MAPDAVANLLLRIIGNVKDGERKVDRISEKLRDFDKTEAEAEVDVETKKAAAELESFRRNLSRLSREVADPKVEVDTNQARANVLLMLAELNKLDVSNADPRVEANVSRAMAELGLLQAMIDKIDADDIEIDVKVRRDLVSRMNQIIGAVGNVTKSVDDMGQAATTTARSVDKASNSAFRMTTNLGPFGLTGAVAKVAAMLVGVAVLAGGAVVAGLAAMAASAAMAAAALGALAVAGGAAFLGLGAIIGGVIWRIQDLIAKGGQLGIELQRAFKQTGAVLAREVSPAFRSIIRTLTAELRNVRPLLEQLREPLMKMTDGFNQGLKIFIDGFKANFPEILALMAQMGPLFEWGAAIAINLLDILLQLANLAMPFLIRGAEAVAQKLGEWAEALRQSPAGLDTIMSHIAGWLELAKQLGRVFLGFLKSAGPAGQELVDWLAEGAEKLADWLNSADGQERMKQFWDEIVPLVKETVEAIGRLIVAFFSLVQAAAPTLILVMQLFNSLLEAITLVLEEFNKLPGPLRTVLTILLLIGGTSGLLGGVLAVLRGLGTAFIIAGALGRVGLSMITTAIPAVIAGLSRLIPAALAIASRFTVVGAAIAAAITYGLYLAGSTSIPDALGKIWQVLQVAGPFGWIFSAATLMGEDVADAIANGLKAGVGAIRGIFTDDIGSIIRSSTAGMANEARRGVADVANAVEQGAAKIRGSMAKGWQGAAAETSRAVANLGRAVDTGIRGILRRADTHANQIGDSIVKGIASKRGQAQAAGAGLGNAVGSGLRNSGAAVAAAASSLSTQALSPIQSSVGSARVSGLAFGNAFANGIAATANAVAAGAQKIAAAAAAQLPQSEPKDPSSPLRGLPKMGRAVATMFAAGIRQGVPLGIAAMEYFTSELAARLQRLGDASTRAGKRLVANLEGILRMAERVQNFQEVVAGLSDTFDQLADSALERWAEFREAASLQVLDSSPLSQELKALLAADRVAEFGGNMQTAQDRIDDAKKALEALHAELADPGRTRSRAQIESEIVNQQRAIRDAEADQARLNRQQRINEINEILEAQRNAIETKAELERQGRTEEAQAYRASLVEQFAALQGMLAAGKISYKRFVREVKKILEPLGLQFQVSGRDEQALKAGRSFMAAFIRGIESAGRRANKVLKDILADLRALLPGSEPKDKTSPLRRLAASGAAVMDNFVAGLERNGKLAMRAMSAEIAPMAQVAQNIAVSPVSAAPVQQGPGVNIEKLERNFHLAPGPDGGYEPMYAAAQIDILLQNEGSL